MTLFFLPRCLPTLALLALCAILNPASAGTATSECPKESAQPSAVEEPRYFGKPTSYWIDKVTADDVHVRRKAVEALAVIGTDAAKAVPALTKALDDDDADVRLGAIDALAAIGPAARPAIPALTRAMSDRSPVFCMRAMDAILKTKVIDNTSVAALLKAMKEGPNAECQYAALDALECFGPDMIKTVVPTLVAIIKDKSSREVPNRGLGSWQAEILRLLPTDQAESLQFLKDCLGEPNLALYDTAAYVIGTMGAKAKFAIPALGKLAKSSLSSEAPRALLAIGPDAQPTLLELLGDQEIGKHVAESICHGGTRALPFLIDALDRGTPVQRANAALALDLMTRWNSEEFIAAMPALQRALKDEDATVRQSVERALQRLQPSGPLGPCMLQK
jgi:HEAT repeat protein